MPDLRDLRGRPLGRNGNPASARPAHAAGHRTRAQERIDEIDVSPTKLLADIEALKGELESTRTKAGGVHQLPPPNVRGARADARPRR